MAPLVWLFITLSVSGWIGMLIAGLTSGVLVWFLWRLSDMSSKVK